MPRVRELQFLVGAGLLLGPMIYALTLPSYGFEHCEKPMPELMPTSATPPFSTTGCGRRSRADEGLAGFLHERDPALSSTDVEPERSASSQAVAAAATLSARSMSSARWTNDSDTRSAC